MYKDAKTKIEDVKSTAWSFTIVAVIGFVLLLSLDFDLLPFTISQEQKPLMSVVMGLVFLVFLIVGLKSFISLKAVSQNALEEEALEKQIYDWFLETYGEEMRSYKSSAFEEEADFSYYPRTEKMEQLIISEYPSVKEDMKEHLIERLYSELFPENK